MIIFATFFRSITVLVSLSNLYALHFFNFQAKNIGSSVAAAMGSIVDLKLVHNVVSVALDKLTEADRRGRAGNEEKMKEQEELKKGITTVVGAALGEQECWEKTACKAGEYAASLPGELYHEILNSGVF